jgi:capsular exopolysaccharide synthesis family protein
MIPSSLVPDRVVPDDGLENQDLSLRQAIKVLRKRYRIILAVAAATLLLIVLALIILPPSYSPVSTIELKQNSTGQLSGELNEVASSLTGGGGGDLKTDLQTAISTFQDQQIGIEVLERMHFEDRAAEKKASFFSKSSIPDKAHRLPLREDPATREMLLEEFEKKLTVERIPDTRLLQVTYKNRDPKFAAAVTNAVVDQYVKDELARRNFSTTQASEWMAGQLDDLRKQVETAQRNLVDFQKKSGFIVVPSMGNSGGGSPGHAVGGSSSGPALQSPLLDRLLSLNQALVAAQANRITQEAVYRVVQTGDANAIAAISTSLAASSGGTGGAGGSVQGNSLSALVALRQQQILLKQQLAANFDVYGAKNPHSVELRQQVAYLDTEMKEEIARLLDTSASTLKIAKDTEAGVRREVGDLEHQADGINDSAVRLSVLQQEADSTRLLYEDLYTKLEESRLSQETQSSDISVISEALPGAKPKFPNWPIGIAIGIFGGLTLGVVTAFFKESLDDSVVTSVQIESMTQMPVLGSIPKFENVSSLPAGKDRSKLPPASTSVLAEVNSQAGEAFRALRTALLLSQAGSAPRTLLVTSPLPSEGKSTTCYNLAVSFAMLDKRVLMIDADMRKPTLHRRINKLNNQGLSTLLTSPSDPADTILRDPNVENLSVILAGPTPPNPTELLGSSIFTSLIDNLSKQYDLVLIDTPPTMLVADSVIVSTAVDGVVIVVRAASSTRLTVLRTLESLQRNKANVMGFVLNFVDTKSSEYYYAHGYYGGNYYGENLYGKDHKS